MKRLVSTTAFALLLVGCGSGIGPGTRKDIASRMSSVKQPLSECYGDAIGRKGARTRGILVLAFKVAPKTGKFEKVEVVRDDIGDDALARCLVDRVATLRLAKPQDVLLAVTYPVSFEPR